LLHFDTRYLVYFFWERYQRQGMPCLQLPILLFVYPVKNSF
jgi:hypothetical protein